MKTVESHKTINLIAEEMQTVVEKMCNIIKLLSELNDNSKDIEFSNNSLNRRFEEVYKLFYVGIFDDTLSVNLEEIKNDANFKKRFLAAFDRRKIFTAASTRDMLEECDYWSGDWSPSHISTITKRLNRLKCKEKSRSSQ